MNEVLYILAVWVHIFAVAVWIGSMFFGDPESTRFFSRLFLTKLGGVGWYAHAVLWPTGAYMMRYRGVTWEELVSTDWGHALLFKVFLVLILVGFQIVVGHRPSKVIYGYVVISFLVIGISVVLSRPELLA